MLKSTLLLAYVGYVSAFTCGDFLFDNCHLPEPITAIHVASIQTCKEACDLYGATCSIFSFDTKPITDENCVIYDNESMDQFHDGCDLIGGPISGSGDDDGNCVVYDDHCDVSTLPNCDYCIACGSNTGGACGDSNCQNIGGDSSIETTVQPSLEVCQGLCKLTQSADGVPATYFTYSKETQACECFTKGTRDCYVKYVVSGADVSTCNL